jgi:hypothetical protein
MRQVAQARGLAADERVAHILARQTRGKHQPVRQHRRHVLGGMHREVDRTAEQRLLDLLGEQALAARLAQRAILDAIARGADRDDLDRVLVPPMRSSERRARQARLRQRERTAARSDANRLRQGTSECYAERNLIS